MKLSIVSLLSTGLLGLSVALPTETPANEKPPNTVVIDGRRLVAARNRISQGEPRYTTALANLLTQADNWLGQGPWTVTDKEKVPPSGNIHDYASQAPYWWPSDTPDGCPYVQRDGQRNPEVESYTDHGMRRRMFNSTYTLSLAWYYTREAKYAEHASRILQTWFIDEDTAMTPHLNHAQIIPCRNTGRAIGIIDFSQEYTNILDAAAILASTNAPGWHEQNQEAFLGWNRAFLTWLKDSPFGIEEIAARNNHGTFANMQVAAIALFVGDEDLAAEYSEVAKPLIDYQIAGNGSQPGELSRTRPWHYVNFNLGAYLRWALVSEKVGVDLFGYRGPEGQTLFRATEVLLEAAVEGQSAWPYEDIGFIEYAATDNVQGAADAGMCKAKRVVPKLPAPPGGDLYVLRPAPHQLDNIAG